MKEIDNNYEMIINYIQKIKLIDFIENFLNRNLINDKKYLINTQFSKKLQVNSDFLVNLIKNFNKENQKGESIDQEVNIQIDTIFKRAKINKIKK